MIVILSAMPAAADNWVLRDDDRQRLDALDQSLGQALRHALAEGEDADLDLLRQGMRGAALPADAALMLLEGEWDCRMIKLGGLLPITAYQPFRCRAGADGSFEKATGSQRTRGQVQLEDNRLIYLGTAFVAGEAPPAYGDLPARPDPQSIPQFLPEIGLVEMVTENAGRIILPQPYLESQANLLVLTRREAGQSGH